MRERERVRNEERKSAANQIISERNHSEEICQGDLRAIRADREKERLSTASIVGEKRAAIVQAEKDATDMRHKLEMDEVERRRVMETER